MIKPLRFEKVRHFEMPQGLVWSILADTDRLNRAIGLSKVTYSDHLEDQGAVYRNATSRVAGLHLKWREYPFSWDQNSSYAVVRAYEEGPLALMVGGINLEGHGPNQTRVVVWSEITPRNLLGRLLASPLANHFIIKTLQLSGRLLQPAVEEPLKQMAPHKQRANGPMLRRLAGSLSKRPVQIEYVEALANWIIEAGDEEIGQIRPFDWADKKALNRDEALRTFLHAVKAGLLNLRWSLMCPNCRVTKRETASLMDVEEQVHCDLCGISYDLNFDRYVELRFAVHPVVRRADTSVYCLMGPARSPHILIQKTMPAGATELIPVLTLQEPLRLRVMKDNVILALSPLAPRCNRVSYKDLAFDTAETSGPFEIHNGSDGSITVMLEKVNWDDGAVTAARVMALQEFKDLFSSEVLKPGREIGIESLTLFFSDLGNSTELYERIGDSPAFFRVGEHFEFLISRIRVNNGAVVKTIGDAVMAVFLSPEDAMRAALSMQKEFPDFCRQHAGLENVPLKIGLHHGPALAVTQNDRLDYFGRTVNIAARVASASVGQDIVFTSEILESDGVQQILEDSEHNLSEFHANFRGLEGQVKLFRVGFEATPPAAP